MNEKNMALSAEEQINLKLNNNPEDIENQQLENNANNA